MSCFFPGDGSTGCVFRRNPLSGQDFLLSKVHKEGGEDDVDKHMIEKEICQGKLHFLLVYFQVASCMMHLAVFIFAWRLVQGSAEGAWFDAAGRWIALVSVMILSIALYAPGVLSSSTLNCWYAFVMFGSHAIQTPFATQPGHLFTLLIIFTAIARIPGSVFATRFSLVFIFNVMASTLGIVQHWYLN